MASLRSRLGCIFTLEIKPIARNGRGEDGYKTFSIRIKNDTVKQLDDIATQTNRSRNELINIFLEFAVSNCVIDE